MEQANVDSGMAGILRVAGLTDVGRVRKHNEDSVAVLADRGLLIVSDGMGGMNAGDVASRLVVDVLPAMLDKALADMASSDSEAYVSAIKQALADLNSKVWKLSMDLPEIAGMGATVVMALLIGARAFIAHLGDSRAYLLRGGRLRLLTKDHLLSDAIFAKGDLSRYVGMESTVQPEVQNIRLESEDHLLLCTDGLTGEVEDDAIQTVLNDSVGLEEGCRSLIRVAGEAGGSDNIAVVLAEWLSSAETLPRIKERCPHCGEMYPDTRPEFTGQAFYCKKCGSKSVVENRVFVPGPSRSVTSDRALSRPKPTVLRASTPSDKPRETTAFRKRNRIQTRQPNSIDAREAEKIPSAAYVGAALNPATLHEAEEHTAADWKPGDVILDLYEIRELLGEGGMGLVYRARHRGWNMDLAVKTPKPEIIAAVGGAEDFAREAETWINLGLHPHVVNCYYVRTLGGIPRIFVEYLEGGTLWDWVRNGKLYAGSQDEVLARILDIAIQAAWGLDCAHRNGLIHQDMKPANVMMGYAGRTKVTDFGLARARSQEGKVRVAAEHGKTVVVAGVGMFTPAYASPEQVAGDSLTLRTDIWSWAATVVEMFAGGLFWSSGHLIGEFLASFLENWSAAETVPRPPDAVEKLLFACFEKEPDSRPSDIREIASVLVDEFRHVTGRSYPRPEPSMGPATGDSLNNRATSLLDLGKQEMALSLWDEALEVQPYHSQVTYNRGLVLWRSGSLDEVQFVKEMEEVLEFRPDNWMAHYLLGLVHMERGDFIAAAESLEAIPKTDRVFEQAMPLLERARGYAPFSRRLVRSLEGHEEPALACVLSRDGKYIISGGQDSTIKLWETDTGTCARTFLGHAGPVVSLSLNRNSTFVLSGGRDGTLRLWDLATGECLHTVRPHGADSVNTAVLSGNGSFALRAGEREGSVSLWDIHKEKYIGSLGGRGSNRSKALLALQSHFWGWRPISHLSDRHSALCVCLSGDDRYALSAARNGSVLFWDVRSRRLLRTLEGHSDIVVSVFLSQDGAYAVTASADTTAKLWDTASGFCLRTFRGRSAAVTSVCLSRDCRYLLTGGADGTVKLWETETSRCLRTFMAGRSAVSAVSMTEDGHLAVSATRDGTIQIWAISCNAPECPAPLMMSRIQTVERAVSKKIAYDRAIKSGMRCLENQDVVSAARHIRMARSGKEYRRHPDALKIWQKLYGRLPKQAFAGGWKQASLEGHADTVNSVCLTRDRKFALSGSSDGTVRLWEVPSGKLSGVFEDRSRSPVTTVCVTADGRLALSASEDKTLKLWKTETGECLMIYEGHLGPVLSADLSHDGLYALSGSLDRTLKLWNVSTGKCLITMSDDLHLPVSVYLSRDGRHALSGSWDKTIKLWKLGTGACVRTFADEFHLPATVCLSHEGRYALSGGTDSHNRHIRLWDVETGRLVRSFEGHSDLVHSVCLSHDNRYALSGSRDGTIKLWEVSTGRCLRTFVSHFGRVFSVALSLDGTYALSGGDDMSVKLWTLDWELEDRSVSDWDEGADPFLSVFLTQHAPYADQLPSYGFWQRMISFVQSRGVKPAWTDEDFDELLYIIRCAGFGWLTREGVRRKLEEYASQWE